MEKPEDVASILSKLNLQDIEETISQPYHKTGPGKPPRSPLGIFKALIVKQLKSIPSDRELYRRLWNDETLREICDIEEHEKPYHPSQITRFRNRVGPERLEDIMTGLLEELVEEGIIKGEALALDATFIKAWSSLDPHDTGRGLGDPDARVGRGKKGFMLGYQSLFLVDIEGFPLGHVEAPLNVNEKQLVEALLDKVLGDCIEVELLVGDSQLESQAIFDLLDELKMSHIIAWRKLKGRVNPPEVLSVKDRIDVEGPEWLRVIYERLRAASESFNGRAKSRLGYQRLTWQGLENVGIHVGLVLMLAYAVCIAAYGIGRPELRQSVAFFA